jgi:hypothetical protein
MDGSETATTFVSSVIKAQVADAVPRRNPAEPRPTPETFRSFLSSTRSYRTSLLSRAIAYFLDRELTAMV